MKRKPIRLFPFVCFLAFLIPVAFIGGYVRGDVGGSLILRYHLTEDVRFDPEDCVDGQMVDSIRYNEVERIMDTWSIKAKYDNITLVGGDMEDCQDFRNLFNEED